MTVVFSLPLEEKTLTAAVNEQSSANLNLPDRNDADYYDPGEPVYADEDDMEAAEIVFRPSYRYRPGADQLLRRRKTGGYRNPRYAGYYYWY